MKKIITMFMVMTLLITTVISSFANDKKQNNSRATKITDKKEIQKLIDEEKIEIVDGYEITSVDIFNDNEIGVQYTDLSNNINDTSENNTSNLAIGTKYKVYVDDMGTGYYNASTDLYYEAYIDGPDNFSFSETHTHTATATTSISGGYEDLVEAKLGFEIGKKYSVTYKSNTKVPAGKSLRMRFYTTYRKKRYEVKKKRIFDDDYWTFLEGYAYKPTGFYIKKNWYDK